MSIKRSNTNGNGGGGETPAAGESQPLAFRENAQVNAKIDAYIEKNPKEWAYIQSMPRERLERSLILQAVQKLDRQEKIRAAVLKKLDENPELKEAYRNLVKNLPTDQQEKAMATIAMRTMRTVVPAQQKPAQGVRVCPAPSIREDSGCARRTLVPVHAAGDFARPLSKRVAAAQPRMHFSAEP